MIANVVVVGPSVGPGAGAGAGARLTAGGVGGGAGDVAVAAHAETGSTPTASSRATHRTGDCLFIVRPIKCPPPESAVPCPGVAKASRELSGAPVSALVPTARAPVPGALNFSSFEPDCVGPTMPPAVIAPTGTIVTKGCTMENVRTGAHHLLPRGDQTLTFFGVFSNDRTVVDSRTGTVLGQECTLVVTMHVRRDWLDGDVARVGFMGSHNGDIFTLEAPAALQYRSGLWDLLFPIRRFTAVTDEHRFEGDAAEAAPQDERHAYAGAFYVETVHGTYFWLKYRGESDFAFDYTSLPTLGSLEPAGL